MFDEVLMDEPDDDAVALFMNKLGLDERVARMLVVVGHTTIEEIAYIPLPELLEIKGVGRELLLFIAGEVTVGLAPKSP